MPEEGFWLVDGVVVELADQGQIHLVIPRAHIRLPVGAGVVALLCAVGDANREGRGLLAGGDLAAAEALLKLAALSVVVEGQPTSPAGWRDGLQLSLLEWATLRLAQCGGSLDPSLPPPRRSPPRFTPRPASGPTIALPEPVPPVGVDLWKTLAARRSDRRGPERTLPLTTLATLLAFTTGVQHAVEDHFGEISFRPVASGGARHPIDLLLVATRVAGLALGLYQYHPVQHALIPVDGDGDAARRLVDLAIGDLWHTPATPPALALLFSAVLARTGCKYDDMALVTVMKDAGCLIQQLYLVAQGLGLTGCALGGSAAPAVERALCCDRNREAFVGGFLAW